MVKQLDTRLRIAQRRAHRLGKRPSPLPSDQIILDRVNGSRVLFVCVFSLAITVSPAASFRLLYAWPVSRFGIVDGRLRDDGIGGMEGHVSRDCTMEQKAKSCYRCGREGHIVRFFVFSHRPLIRYLRNRHLMTLVHDPSAQLRIAVT